MSSHFDDDDNSANIEYLFGMKSIAPSESNDPMIHPFSFPHPQAFNDPLNTPLINTSHSIAYAFSSSSIDPFSNLIRFFHQNSNNYNEIFMELTQTLAFSAKPVDFLPILIKLLDEKENTFDLNLRHLALQSIIVLSVNNQDFSNEVLEKIEIFISLAQSHENEFLEAVLELFENVSPYASLSNAKLIIDFISQNNLVKHSPSNDPNNLKKPQNGPDPIRARSFSVLSILAKYGQLFNTNLVEEIIQRCNYPGKSLLYREISLPVFICIDQLLKQPGTKAYNLLLEKKGLVIGKMALAVTLCEENTMEDLTIMILKVFLEFLDESQITEFDMYHLQLKLTTALISLQNFASKPVQNIAKLLLNRFKP